VAERDVSRALAELVRYYRTRPEPDPAGFAQPDPQAVARADEALRHDFVFYNEPGHVPGESIDWTYRPGIDWEWTWALNRHGWWSDLCAAYLQTGSETYMRELDLLIRTWVGGHPATVEDASAWRTIEAGIRTMGPWMSILGALKKSPAISQAAWLYYLRSIQDHAEFLLANPKGGNWLLMETNGVLACGLNFPEFKRAQVWVETAIQKFEYEIIHQTHPDGAQEEYSTSYHFVCLDNFEMALERVDRAVAAGQLQQGFSDAYRQRLTAMWAYVMWTMRPDGHHTLLNDADNFDSRAALEGAGLKYHRPDFVFAASGGQRGQAPAQASVRLPWARRAALRSGWGPQAYFALLETAPFGYGHQHEDALGFELFAHGRPLVGMMGRFTYARVPRREYLISSQGHNVLLIDGQGQNQRSLQTDFRQTAPRPVEWIAQSPTQDPWVSSPELDIAFGQYSGPWTGGLSGVTWTRRLFFHRPDTRSGRPAFWLVHDRVEGAGEHELTFLLHFFPGEVTLSPESQRIQTHFAGPGGNVLVQFLSAQPLTLDAAHGQIDPPRGWYSQEYGLIEPAWEVRASCRATLPYEQVMVFVPFAGENAPQLQIERSGKDVQVMLAGNVWSVAV
jgi:hypothetical protein